MSGLLPEPNESAEVEEQTQTEVGNEDLCQSLEEQQPSVQIAEKSNTSFVIVESK